MKNKLICANRRYISLARPKELSGQQQDGAGGACSSLAQGQELALQFRSSPARGSFELHFPQGLRLSPCPSAITNPTTDFLTAPANSLALKLNVSSSFYFFEGGIKAACISLLSVFLEIVAKKIKY